MASPPTYTSLSTASLTMHVARLNRNASDDTLCEPINESQPLLRKLGDAPSVPGRTPLPKTQLAVLCLIRLADPIAFTQLFPYVNDMVVRFGIADPAGTGFYSGLVESVFAVFQLISIYQWAEISNRVGRKPVVLLGTVGIALSTVYLGFSRTLLSILFARALAGFFSGNVAVMHAVLGEMTDASNQALAYPVYGLCWPLGVVIGPLIGGTFSDPAEKFGHWLNSDLFKTFPYLLPCLVVAVLTLLMVLLGYALLLETLPRKLRSQKDYSYETNDELRTYTMDSGSPPTVLQLLRLPLMRAVCMSGCALSFVGSAFDVVFVLFCYSSVKMGGLGFSVSQIGYALAVAGILSAVFQIAIMPIALRSFSCTKLYKFCIGLWPFTFILLPPLNWIASSESNNSAMTFDRQLLWLGISIILAISRVGCLAFSLNMILVKAHSPGADSLASANGLAQFFQCFSRAVAPAFVSCLFAYSTEHQLLGGHLWMVLMLALSLVSWAHALTLPEEDKNGNVDIADVCEAI